jgi:hypothetical protein
MDNVIHPEAVKKWLDSNSIKTSILDLYHGDFVFKQYLRDIIKKEALDE